MWLNSKLFRKLCLQPLLPVTLVLVILLMAIGHQLETRRRDQLEDNIRTQLRHFQHQLTGKESVQEILNSWASTKQSLNQSFSVLNRKDQEGLPVFSIQSANDESPQPGQVESTSVLNEAMQRLLWRESGDHPVASTWDLSGKSVVCAASRLKDESGTRFVILSHDVNCELSQDQSSRQWMISIGVVAWLSVVAMLAFVGFTVIRPVRYLLQAARNPLGSLEHRDALLRLQDRKDEFGDLSRALETSDEDSKGKQDRVAKQAQLMKESSNQLSAILQAMVEGVIAIDEDQSILFANDVACHLMDMNVETAMQRPLFECVRSTVILDAVNEVIQHGEMIKVEFKLSRQDTFLNLVVSPFAKGGVILVLHDVTAIRRLEVLRKDFINGVSHELKTPLTVIQACTDTLINGAASDPEVARRFLNKIGTQSERLHQLIVGMLQLSRVESGQQVFMEEAVDLAAVSNELMDQLQPIADSTQIQLSYDGPEEAYVLGDHQAIRTIVNNLIDNALKYTNEEGTVQILVKEEPDANVISVRDNGVGISPEDQARIFERFYRVEKDRNRERGGTGLGLAIVKHLCHALKAEVSVHSQHGEGCEFSVRFPFQEEGLEDG